MEHSEAISTKAAERYLLGELNEPDADAFEEHFFDCILCADDVRDETRLIEAGRAVARENRPKVVSIDTRKRPNIGWLQVAAAVILVVGIGGMQLMLRRPKPIVAIAHQAFLTTNRDRAADNTYILRDKKFVNVLVPDVSTGDYRWNLADASGTSVERGTAGKDDTRDGFNLLLGDLPAGNYTLLVDGVQETDGKHVTITQRFTIRR